MAKTFRVLVTGGAGFVGSYLVKQLIKSGCRVRVLDDLSSGDEGRLNGVPCSEIIVGDVRDRLTVQNALEGVEAVAHLAAKIDVAESFEKPESYDEVNVHGTLNILKGCVKEGVKRLVYVSTCAVYGEPLNLPIDETHPVNPKSPYAASKLAAEAYCKAYADTYDMNLIIVRLFNVYGPGQLGSPYAGVITKFIKRLKEGKPPIIFGDGGQTRDFIYVGEAAEAIAKLLLSGVKKVKNGEIFNVGSGEATSIKELASLLIKLINREDLKPLYSKARLGEVKYSQADISKIRKIIRFRPKISLKEGLKLTIEREGESTLS